MKRGTLGLVATLLVALPAMLSAQDPMRQQPQMDRMQRTHEMMQQMDHLITQVRALNQQLTQQRAPDALREMGHHMERACDGLQIMPRQMERLQNNPAMEQDHEQGTPASQCRCHNDWGDGLSRASTPPVGAW